MRQAMEQRQNDKIEIAVLKSESKMKDTIINMKDVIINELKTEAFKPKTQNISITLAKQMEYSKSVLEPFENFLEDLPSIINSKLTIQHFKLGFNEIVRFISNDLLGSDKTYYITYDKQGEDFHHSYEGRYSNR